jgi:hypothetical protein
VINTRGDDVTRRWTVRLTAGLVAATALLTGCSEKQPASETLPTQTAAETTPELPSLGPDDMPMPDDARTQDAAGAEAFVRYYFDLLNKSLSDMDPQYLRQFAEAGCDVCERIATETETDAAAGYSYRGGELTITSDVGIMMSGPNEAESGFVADQAPMTVLDGAGNPVPDLVFDGEDGLNSGTVMIWDESTTSWKMTELTLG